MPLDHVELLHDHRALLGMYGKDFPGLPPLRPRDHDHRIALYIQLCRQLTRLQVIPIPIWRSKLHNDGTSFDGWFILGIYKEKGRQISYHLPMSKWEETNFVETLDKAPEFDGHTSADVIERLKYL